MGYQGGESGGRSIMMQRWRGCGTLVLARALAIGRSANHSFGNNRLHTLHTKDTRELAKNCHEPGLLGPISTYDSQPPHEPLRPRPPFPSSLPSTRPWPPSGLALPFGVAARKLRSFDTRS